jgi:O-antigen ligase
MLKQDGLFEPQRLAFGLLAFYSVASLTSMAGMSVAATLVLLGMVSGLFLSRPFRNHFAMSARGVLSSRSFQIWFRLSLFLILALVSSLFASILFPYREVPTRDLPTIEKDLGKLLYFVFPFVWAVLLKMMKPVARSRVILIWVGATGILGLLAIVQFFTGFPRPQLIPTSPQFFHATLFFGHHLSTASILIFPAFVGLLVGKDAAGQGEGPVQRGALRTRKLFLLACATLGFLAVFLSFSRMAWIALPFGLLAAFLRWTPRRILIQRLFVSLLALALAIGVSWSLSPTLQERVRNPMGISTRFELWKWNWQMFQDRPILGVGWRRSSTFVREVAYEAVTDLEARKNLFISHAHNNFIEMLSGTGVLGTLAWLLFSGFPLYLGLKHRGRNAHPGAVIWGVFCAWVVFQLNGLTQVNFWEGKVMHQWALALGFMLYFAQSNESSSERE